MLRRGKGGGVLLFLPLARRTGSTRLRSAALRALGLVLLALATLAPPAAAVPLTFSFSGVVEAEDAGILRGLPFEGAVRLDPQLPGRATIIGDGSGGVVVRVEPEGARFSVRVGTETLEGPLAVVASVAQARFEPSPSLPLRPLPSLASAALIFTAAEGSSLAPLPFDELIEDLAGGCCEAALRLAGRVAAHLPFDVPLASLSVEVPEPTLGGLLLAGLVAGWGRGVRRSRWTAPRMEGRSAARRCRPRAGA